MNTAVLLIIALDRKQRKCPSAGEWLKTFINVCCKYCSAMTWNGHVTRTPNPNDTDLSQNHQAESQAQKMETCYVILFM